MLWRALLQFRRIADRHGGTLGNGGCRPALGPDMGKPLCQRSNLPAELQSRGILRIERIIDHRVVVAVDGPIIVKISIAPARLGCR